MFSGTYVFTMTGGTGDTRRAAAWSLLDGSNARLLGPLSPSTMMAVDDATQTFYSLEMQEDQIVLLMIPPGSAGHAPMREQVRLLGGRIRRAI